MTNEQIEIHISKLEEALADNVLSIEFEGKRTVFDNAEAIILRIAYFKTKLSSANSTRVGRGPRRTTVYTNSRKGL